MSTAKPLNLLAMEYERYAQEYLRSLPLEHFMESTSQATQRKITWDSLGLVQASRPEVQVFNELLVQYPYGREKKPHQVVPDNMVVLWNEPIRAEGSYDVPLQPVRPFWVLEYVSRHSKRKDYEDNFRKFERELKVPYYLLFHPEKQELMLYHHTKRKYTLCPRNAEGAFEIPELEMQMKLRDEWVRFWYQGKLLLLPAELLQQIDEQNREIERLRAQLARQRGRWRKGPE
jgi:Uma2 family endonuclease